MKAILSAALGALALTLAVSAQAGGCEYDTQCKGDRICEAGICVTPAAPLPPAPPRTVRADESEPMREPPREPPTYCCTSVGKLGPYPLKGENGQPAKLLDACMGKFRNGVDVPGKACY